MGWVRRTADNDSHDPGRALLLVKRQVKLRARGLFERACLSHVRDYADDLDRSIRRRSTGVCIAAAELLAKANAMPDGVTFWPVEARHRVADHHRARGVAAILRGQQAALKQSDAHGAEISWADDSEICVLCAAGVLRPAPLDCEVPGGEIHRAIDHGLPGSSRGAFHAGNRGD